MIILNYNDEITTAYALTIFYKIRAEIGNESLKMRFYFLLKTLKKAEKNA